jgi:hypothetical protein
MAFKIINNSSYTSKDIQGYTLRDSASLTVDKFKDYFKCLRTENGLKYPVIQSIVLL